MDDHFAIDEASFGNNHPNVAASRWWLATFYQATNRLEEAEPLLKEAARILENSLGSGHPRTVGAKNHLQLLQNAVRDAEKL